jgi:hypothetical protein
MTEDKGYAFVENPPSTPTSANPDQRRACPSPPSRFPSRTAKPLIDLPHPETIDLGAFDLRKAIEERRITHRQLQRRRPLAGRTVLPAVADPGHQVEINEKRACPCAPSPRPAAGIPLRPTCQSTG